MAAKGAGRFCVNSPNSRVLLGRKLRFKMNGGEPDKSGSPPLLTAPARNPACAAFRLPVTTSIELLLGHFSAETSDVHTKEDIALHLGAVRPGALLVTLGRECQDVSLTGRRRSR